MLTKRQRDVLVFVQRYMAKEGGVSPTCSEISEGIGIASKGKASEYLRALEERGFIRRLAGRCRAIEVLKCAPGVERRRIPVFDAHTNQVREYLP